MKKLLVLSVAMACAFGVQAQQAEKSADHLAIEAKQEVERNAARKTTAADSRLIASARYQYYNSAFVPLDSTVYAYSGNNGWDAATQGWKYDNASLWKYDYATSVWNENERWYGHIANNRIDSQLFMKKSGSVWQDNRAFRYTYFHGLLSSTQTDQDMGSGITPRYLLTNTYNYDRQITEQLNQRWILPTQLDNITSTINHYNCAKQNDTTIKKIWAVGKWKMDTRDFKTYGNGYLIAVWHQSFKDTVWNNSTNAIYHYNPQGKLAFVAYDTWNKTSASWEKNYAYAYSYDSKGNMVEEKFGSPNNGVYTYYYRNLYTYDQYGRRLTEENESWDPAWQKWYHNTGDRLMRYYYEPYTNDVTAVEPNIDMLTVFPVPANDQLTISASFKQAQPVSIAITDMNGRVVKQLTDEAGRQYSKQIDVSGIAAGNYIIGVGGTTEQTSKTIAIEH